MELEIPLTASIEPYLEFLPIILLYIAQNKIPINQLTSIQCSIRDRGHLPFSGVRKVIVINFLGTFSGRKEWRVVAGADALKIIEEIRLIPNVNNVNQLVYALLDVNLSIEILQNIFSFKFGDNPSIVEQIGKCSNLTEIIFLLSLQDNYSQLFSALLPNYFLDFFVNLRKKLEEKNLLGKFFPSSAKDHKVNLIKLSSDIGQELNNQAFLAMPYILNEYISLHGKRPDVEGVIAGYARLYGSALGEFLSSKDNPIVLLLIEYLLTRGIDKVDFLLRLGPALTEESFFSLIVGHIREIGFSSRDFARLAPYIEKHNIIKIQFLAKDLIAKLFTLREEEYIYGEEKNFYVNFSKVEETSRILSKGIDIGLDVFYVTDFLRKLEASFDFYCDKSTRLLRASSERDKKDAQRLLVFSARKVIENISIFKKNASARLETIKLIDKILLKSVNNIISISYLSNDYSILADYLSTVAEFAESATAENIARAVMSLDDVFLDEVLMSCEKIAVLVRGEYPGRLTGKVSDTELPIDRLQEIVSTSYEEEKDIPAEIKINSFRMAVFMMKIIRAKVGSPEEANKLRVFLSRVSVCELLNKNGSIAKKLLPIGINIAAINDFFIEISLQHIMHESPLFDRKFMAFISSYNLLLGDEKKISHRRVLLDLITKNKNNLSKEKIISLFMSPAVLTDKAFYEDLKRVLYGCEALKDITVIYNKCCSSVSEESFGKSFSMLSLDVVVLLEIFYNTTLEKFLQRKISSLDKFRQMIAVKVIKFSQSVGIALSSYHAASEDFYGEMVVKASNPLCDERLIHNIFAIDKAIRDVDRFSAHLKSLFQEGIVAFPADELEKIRSALESLLVFNNYAECNVFLHKFWEEFKLYTTSLSGVASYRGEGKTQIFQDIKKIVEKLPATYDSHSEVLALCDEIIAEKIADAPGSFIEVQESFSHFIVVTDYLSPTDYCNDELINKYFNISFLSDLRKKSGPRIIESFLDVLRRRFLKYTLCGKDLSFELLKSIEEFLSKGYSQNFRPNIVLSEYNFAVNDSVFNDLALYFSLCHLAPDRRSEVIVFLINLIIENSDNTSVHEKIRSLIFLARKNLPVDVFRGLTLAEHKAKKLVSTVEKVYACDDASTGDALWLINSIRGNVTVKRGRGSSAKEVKPAVLGESLDGLCASLEQEEISDYGKVLEGLCNLSTSLSESDSLVLSNPRIDRIYDQKNALIKGLYEELVKNNFLISEKDYLKYKSIFLFLSIMSSYKEGSLDVSSLFNTIGTNFDKLKVGFVKYLLLNFHDLMFISVPEGEKALATSAQLKKIDKSIKTYTKEIKFLLFFLNDAYKFMVHSQMRLVISEYFKRKIFTLGFAEKGNKLGFIDSLAEVERVDVRPEIDKFTRQELLHYLSFTYSLKLEFIDMVMSFFNKSMSVVKNDLFSVYSVNSSFKAHSHVDSLITGCYFLTEDHSESIDFLLDFAETNISNIREKEKILSSVKIAQYLHEVMSNIAKFGVENFAFPDVDLSFKDISRDCSSFKLGISGLIEILKIYTINKFSSPIEIRKQAVIQMLRQNSNISDIGYFVELLGSIYTTSGIAYDKEFAELLIDILREKIKNFIDSGTGEYELFNSLMSGEGIRTLCILYPDDIKDAKTDFLLDNLSTIFSYAKPIDNFCKFFKQYSLYSGPLTSCIKKDDALAVEKMARYVAKNKGKFKNWSKEIKGVLKLYSINACQTLELDKEFDPSFIIYDLEFLSIFTQDESDLLLLKMVKAKYFYCRFYNYFYSLLDKIKKGDNSFFDEILSISKLLKEHGDYIIQNTDLKTRSKFGAIVANSVPVMIKVAQIVSAACFKEKLERGYSQSIQKLTELFHQVDRKLQSGSSAITLELPELFSEDRDMFDFVLLSSNSGDIVEFFRNKMFGLLHTDEEQHKNHRICRKIKNDIIMFFNLIPYVCDKRKSEFWFCIFNFLVNIRPMKASYFYGIYQDDSSYNKTMVIIDLIRSFLDIDDVGEYFDTTRVGALWFEYGMESIKYLAVEKIVGIIVSEASFLEHTADKIPEEFIRICIEKESGLIEKFESDGRKRELELGEIIAASDGTKKLEAEKELKESKEIYSGYIENTRRLVETFKCHVRVTGTRHSRVGGDPSFS